MLTEVLEQLYKLKIEAAAEADVQQGVVLQQAAQRGRQAGLPAQRAQHMWQRRSGPPLHKCNPNDMAPLATVAIVLNICSIRSLQCSTSAAYAAYSHTHNGMQAQAYMQWGGNGKKDISAVGEAQMEADHGEAGSDLSEQVGHGLVSALLALQRVASSLVESALLAKAIAAIPSSAPFAARRLCCLCFLCLLWAACRIMTSCLKCWITHDVQLTLNSTCACLSCHPFLDMTGSV